MHYLSVLCVLSQDEYNIHISLLQIKINNNKVRLWICMALLCAVVEIKLMITLVFKMSASRLIWDRQQCN